ncbi:hypothetical protein [Bacillus benzoevorans]|uniref:Uncharacterized protein n=1 Tax=Bacillus benzoevorans TaxID=1456 RepID=A0A7X0LTM6_9BACI|nr:hypothetical protein [Bacillus benzoevorans]MBB6443653.1 hypothetical protein [Bacillus benzoevorans]
MNQINFSDFYQKALIPMGKNEQKRSVQIDKDWRAAPLTITHFLIAIEGKAETTDAEKYHWKVSIYLADSEGSFYSEKPIYHSEYYKSIHCAFSAARKLEEAGKAGHLLARYFH